jgi:hypothetical protein
VSCTTLTWDDLAHLHVPGNLIRSLPPATG